MKNLLLTAAAGLALVSPLAAPAFAQGPDRRGEQSRQGDDRRTDDRRDDNRRSDDRQGQYRDSNHESRADEARRSDRRDRRERGRDWRDDRREARFDDSLHNGYYSGGRWYYGPPSHARARNATYGYRPWRRGQHLGYYNTRYVEVDHREHRLRAPPRGYHWVRNNDGDMLLAAIVGGLIAQVILSDGRY